MDFVYETPRLSLQILGAKKASDVLLFLENGKQIFEKYEPKRPENFYTIDYQKDLLTYEYNLTIRQTAVRFYVFLKDNPSEIIGTVCFRNIKKEPFASCEVGYKFDERFWHQGYAFEALQKGIEIMFFELNLHRIAASVRPDNLPSIRLLEHLGFEWEGCAKQSTLLQGKWEDHLQYALLNEYYLPL